MIPQRVLITGGAGFIGSHTADLLLAQNVEVIVLDNLYSGKMENLQLRHSGLEFVEGDVLEYPLVEEMVANCDAVLHLAAIPSVPYSIDHPIYSLQVNTQGFLHVLEAVRLSGRPIRLVYASSAAVYGEAEQLPCNDAEPLSAQPLSPYALQKIQDEQYADLYRRLHGVNSLALRYFNVYGSRQDPQSPYSGVISRFMNAYQQDQGITIFGDGQQSRDFIAVADVAKANWLALCGEYGGVMNVATGQPETLLQMIEYIEKAGGKSLQKSFQPARQGDIRSSYATTALAEKQLDFRYATSLETGMSQLLKHLSAPEQG
jgi:UDP-glucose 4-epimerase